MFTKYEIKNINNEDVLIIHMNYDYEFAKELGSIENNITITDKIKEYIKKMKIDFKGKYIVLMIAGIATITLMCNSFKLDEKEQTFIPNPEIVSMLNYKTYEDVFTIKPTISDNIKEEIVKPEITPEVKPEKPNISENKPTQKPIENKPTTPENKPSNPETKPEKPNMSENKPIQKPSPNETYVTLYRSNGMIETILLEDYVIGVVGSEMPASFHSEALKAQAIVARTYAIKRINEGKVLTDTTNNQVYKDNNQLKKLWGNSYNTYYNKIKEAVESTTGLIVTYNNKPIDAVYHSTSNGYTVDAKDVWGNDIPYLKSVSSNYDKTASSYLREINKEINDIIKLGINIKEDSIIEIISKDSNNRVKEIKIDEKIYSGVDFRNKLGLRSTDFEILFDGNIITFTTRGYGHGVGMSQYGANGMANNGYTYSQIINHYYTNIKIQKK